MKSFLLIIILTLLTKLSYSSAISGTITNESGEFVPFAAVYIPEIHKGTTANLDGEFFLEIEPGVYTIHFQYLGYETLEKKVNVDQNKNITLDIVLIKQEYNLPEVVISASGEDPAYYIMRRAIGMSQYYLNQVSAYTSSVYLKGSGVITKIPKLMKRQMEKEGIKENEFFVTETISEIDFELPSTTNTRVISTRSSGDDQNTSPMAFVSMSLYRDINGIISPLSKQAFRVYRFKLEGTFMENGIQVNKIKVIPKRKGYDLYSGHIFIKEGTWSLHTVDLRVEQSMFDLEFRQVYNPVAQGVWMPVSHDFDFNISVMGLEMNYKYLVSVTDYQITLNPDIDHEFYKNLMASNSTLFLLESREVSVNTAQNNQDRSIELRKPIKPKTRREKIISELMSKNDLNNREMKRLNRLIEKESEEKKGKPPLEVRGFSYEMEDSATVRSADYWNNNRPVPLTGEELASFDEMEPDSVSADSLDKKSSWVGDVLTGADVRLNDNWKIQHNGLIWISSFDFNTVDGFLYKKNARLYHSSPDDKRFHISNESSWAFARNRFLTEFELYRFYDPFKRASLQLNFGRTSSDFQSTNGVNNLLNTFSTLFLRQNPMKLFEKDFIELNHTTDIVNGLVLKTSLGYSERRHLENNTDFNITQWQTSTFTPNLPPINEIDAEPMALNQAFTYDVGLSYTHRHYYMRSGKRKIMLYSNFPTISVNYKQSIPGVLGSDADFSLLETSLSQSFDVKMIGEFQYRLTGGTFLNKQKLFTPDLKYFSGNYGWVTTSQRFDRYRTLDFYTDATQSDYFEGFFNYEHSRILIKRLPFLAQSIMKENLFFNTLLVNGRDPFYETGYGVSQIFLLFNFEVVFGFRGNDHQFTGFRIGVPLDGGEITL